MKKILIICFVLGIHTNSIKPMLTRKILQPKNLALVTNLSQLVPTKKESEQQGVPSRSFCKYLQLEEIQRQRHYKKNRNSHHHEEQNQQETRWKKSPLLLGLSMFAGIGILKNEKDNQASIEILCQEFKIVTLESVKHGNFRPVLQSLEQHQIALSKSTTFKKELAQALTIYLTSKEFITIRTMNRELFTILFESGVITQALDLILEQYKKTKLFSTLALLDLITFDICDGHFKNKEIPETGAGKAFKEFMGELYLETTEELCQLCKFYHMVCDCKKSDLDKLSIKEKETITSWQKHINCDKYITNDEMVESCVL